jgi:RHS repeat-associated protein
MLVERLRALPAAPVDGNGNEYSQRFTYYHDDHLGSTGIVTDRCGQIVQQVTYTPYGEMRSELNLGASVNYLYTGQQFDREVGLYYYGARYYDQSIGRFISPDTVIPNAADSQSYNRYAYCLNDPIQFNDPTGHEPNTYTPPPPVDPPKPEVKTPVINHARMALVVQAMEGTNTGSPATIPQKIEANAPKPDANKPDAKSAQVLGKLGFDWSGGNENKGESVAGKVVDKANDANDVADAVGVGLKETRNARFGNDGKLRLPTESGGVFNGNGSVKTFSLAKGGKNITKFSGPVGYGLGAAEIAEGARQDGGTFGPNAQEATVDVAGSLAGAWACGKFFGVVGSEFGFEVGLFFGNPFAGAAIGGFVGGVGGSLAGAYYGAEGAKALYNNR